jgi:hypothetical protein
MLHHLGVSGRRKSLDDVLTLVNQHCCIAANVMLHCGNPILKMTTIPPVFTPLANKSSIHCMGMPWR